MLSCMRFGAQYHTFLLHACMKLYLSCTVYPFETAEIFGGTEWFGRVNILFVGYILQLPPVNDNPVFSKLTNTLVANKFVCEHAVNICSRRQLSVMN